MTNSQPNRSCGQITWYGETLMWKCAMSKVCSLLYTTFYSFLLIFQFSLHSLVYIVCSSLCIIFQFAPHFLFKVVISWVDIQMQHVATTSEYKPHFLKAEVFIFYYTFDYILATIKNKYLYWRDIHQYINHYGVLKF